MAVLGLGRWVGRETLPLSWISVPAHLKTFGVTVVPFLASTISLSWEDCLGRIQRAIHTWRDRAAHFLREGRDVLEVYIFPGGLHLQQAEVWPKFSPSSRRWPASLPP
jgi:hypothetical protein